ncbi:MAG: DNA primase large subunit PriL [Candidatus Bathyarchaeia archaeon]
MNRAQERIEEALQYATITKRSRNDEIEILSFPIAILITAAANDELLKKRYALAEAKRVYNLLKLEKNEKIIEIAKTFQWNLTPQKLSIGNQTYEFTVDLQKFLKNSTSFNEAKWKLVNRIVINGKVYATKNEVARLLAEETRRYIEQKLAAEKLTLPQNIANYIEKLRQHASKRKREIKLEELPKDMVIEAFPPCIKSLYNAITSGHHLSHIGRFTLTSFLINVGMTPENVTEIFHSLSDFSERMTRYQVEHIAGTRGSRTKYIPPKCDTLRTHGVCLNPDYLCGKIRHPLAYYRRKLKTLKTPLEKETSRLSPVKTTSNSISD